MRAATLVAAVACVLAPPARADFQLWSEAGVSAEVREGLRLGFDQEVRMDRGASQLDVVRPAIWGSWRATGWLSLRLGYRYEIEPHFTKGKDYADGWHEGWLDTTLRAKVDRVRLSVRLRYEEKAGRPWTADGELVRSRSLRQRLELAWPVWRRLALEGSGELFLRLADPDGLLDKWRASAGVALSLGPHELGIRYRFEQPFTPGDERAHVLGLSYHWAP